MANELRHFVQTIYEASDAPAWAHDRAAQLLDMPSLAHGCAKDRAEIDEIKKRLRYKCEEQQSPDCMVLDDQRLEYRVTIAEFLEFIRDHDRQAKELADIKRVMGSIEQKSEGVAQRIGEVEAIIDGQKVVIAAKDAEIAAWKMASGLERRGDGGESIEPDNLERRIQQDDSALAAADEWDAQMLVEFNGNDEICPVCGREEPHGSHWGSCPWVKYHNIRAAYSATRSKEQRTGLSLEGLLAVKHGHYTEIAKLDNEIAELRDSATRTEENENV